MNRCESGSWAMVCALGILGFGSFAGAETKKPAGDKVPITTSSEEARQAYLKGRDLNEKLRATDAHKLFVEAVAKDKDFALAHLAVAQTSGTAKEFFASLADAVAASAKASEGERLLIQGTDAGARGKAGVQKEMFIKVTKLFPNDERAHNTLGGLYFGQQDYALAVAEYEKAVKINPSFSQPYNQLGYAYRFMDKYPQAEEVFKKYIQLIPDDPNPYDSYAEFLMKTGRFDESIASYQKALSVDPNFIASYVGIGNNQMFMGKGDEARKTFEKLLSVARNDGEKRQALFWMAVSYVHEGATDKALAEVQKEAAVAEASMDLANLGADHNLIGNILLEAGQPDQAGEEFKTQLDLIDKANVPPEVKDGVHRNRLFDEARVLLAKNDIAGAKAKSKTYATQVAAKKIPFEMRQQHELVGTIAIAEKNYALAVTELQQANQQDPRVLYHLAIALQGKGDAKKAKEIGDKAANFNGLAGNYAFVRKKAQAMFAKG
jgi:tetratricopeptide (TPR) repeat protein